MTQPKIGGVGHGKPVMPFGSDGTDWYALLVDGLGHLQVDVLSAALGSGGATEATLLLIKGYVDALETLLAGGLPAALDSGGLKVKEQSPLTGFATATNQTTMITALQLIDDLRAALGSVNTDDLQVDVKTSALPTDAATQTTLALVKTAVEKIDDLQGALGSVATDILRVASKSGDKIFGFESKVTEKNLSVTISGAEGYIASDAVPTGKIWIITNIVTRNRTTATTAHTLTVWDGTNLTDFAYQYATAPALVRVTWSGHIYLAAGDVVRVWFAGGLANDLCDIHVTGYQMNAP